MGSHTISSALSLRFSDGFLIQGRLFAPVFTGLRSVTGARCRAHAAHQLLAAQARRDDAAHRASRTVADCCSDKLKRGALLEKEHVDFVVTNLLLVVRNHLLAIPSRVTRQLLRHVADETGNDNFQAIYTTVNTNASRYDESR